MASGSGWNLWVLRLGVVVRRYIRRFPHTTPLVSVLFYNSIPTFCSFFKYIGCKHRASEGVFYIGCTL